MGAIIEFPACRGYLPNPSQSQSSLDDINILRFYNLDDEVYLKYDSAAADIYATWKSDMFPYPFVQGKYQMKSNLINSEGGKQDIGNYYISNKENAINSKFYLNNTGIENPQNSVIDYNQSREAQDVTIYMKSYGKIYFCKFDFNLQADFIGFDNNQLVNFITLTGFTNANVEVLLS